MRTAAIAPFLIPHPLPTWLSGLIPCALRPLAPQPAGHKNWQPVVTVAWVPWRETRVSVYSLLVWKIAWTHSHSHPPLATSTNTNVLHSSLPQATGC